MHRRLAVSRLRKGWRRVKFGDVARLVTDRCDPVATGIERFVGLEHLEPGSLRIRSWGSVAGGTTFTSRFRPGHLLFGKRRAYQRKVAVADFEGVCSGDIYVLESRDAATLRPALLPFLCQTEDFFMHAVGTSAGSLSPRTNWTRLAEYEFALPPVDEQARIVTVLRCTSDAVDHYQAAMRAGESAYMAALVSGLTRHHPGAGVPPDYWAKESWPLVPLESLTSSDAPISYGIVQVGDSVEGGVPTATSNSLNVGFRDKVHRTHPRIEAAYARSRIREGDVLVTVKGFGTGNIGVVPVGFSGNINRDLARIRFPNSADAEYFVHLWRCPRFERYWRAVRVGTTRPELSIGPLRRMKIPWPPSEVRKALAHALMNVRQCCGRLADRAESARALHRTTLECAFFHAEARVGP
jgi:type I restriction enzyme S subunit